MKLSAKNIILNEELLHNLPIGVVLISNDSHILLANKKAEQLLLKDKKLTTRTKLHSVLVESKNIEVQQLRRIIKQVDYAIETEQKIVTQYSPLLGKNHELQGVILLLQSFNEFNDMVYDFTKLEYWRSAMQKIAHFPGKSFRVVNKSGQTDVASSDWSKIIEYTEKLTEYTEQQFTQAMNKRRTIQTVINTETIINQSLILITEPIFHNGKIAGCLQEIKVKKQNQDTERKLEVMTKLVRKLENNYKLVDIIGQTTEMQLVREQAKLYMKTARPILISGEKGTGKRTLAKAIHNESKLQYEAFLTFDCNHPSFSLNKMKIHLAQLKKGTAFIYNVGNLFSADNLLRTLEEYTDFQLILSSTNIETFNSLKNHISLPPLRERVDDIPFLVTYFIELFNNKYNLNIEKVDEDLMKVWMKNEWPGNVAELEITVGNMMNAVSSNQTKLNIEDLKVFTTNDSVEVETDTLQNAVDQFEKKFIVHTLKECNHNKTKTAKLLGISIRSLYYKMEKYQIDGGD